MADFDKAAADYDVQFTHSKIGQVQRQRVWKYLDQTILKDLKEPKSILELNCGTGEDARWMAKKGHSVIATDVSLEILKVAEEKIAAGGLSDSVQVQQLDLSKINAINLPNKFDLIFSNFGGFNCLSIENLKALNQWMPNQLKSGGEMILVIMPKDTLVEKLFAIKEKESDRIKKRKSKEGTLINVNGAEVRTYFYNWQEIANIFNRFEVVKVFPSGLVPSYLEGFVNRNPKTWKLIKKLEKQIERQKNLANWGDHFVLHLQIN